MQRVGRWRKLSTVLNAAERSNKVTAGVSSQRAAVAAMRSFCPSVRAGARMLKLLVGLMPCDYLTCIHVGVWRSNIYIHAHIDRCYTRRQAHVHSHMCVVCLPVHPYSGTLRFASRKPSAVCELSIFPEDTAVCPMLHYSPDHMVFQVGKVAFTFLRIIYGRTILFHGTGSPQTLVSMPLLASAVLAFPSKCQLWPVISVESNSHLSTLQVKRSSRQTQNTRHMVFPGFSNRQTWSFHL